VKAHTPRLSGGWILRPMDLRRSVGGSGRSVSGSGWRLGPCGPRAWRGRRSAGSSVRQWRLQLETVEPSPWRSLPDRAPAPLELEVLERLLDESTPAREAWSGACGLSAGRWRSSVGLAVRRAGRDRRLAYQPARRALAGRGEVRDAGLQATLADRSKARLGRSSPGCGVGTHRRGADLVLGTRARTAGGSAARGDRSVRIAARTREVQRRLADPRGRASPASWFPPDSPGATYPPARHRILPAGVARRTAATAMVTLVPGGP